MFEGIIININLIIDKNHYIEDIIIFKEIEVSSSSHFRPQTRSSRITKKDISRFCEILYYVSIDETKVIYDTLECSFKKNEELSNGIRFVSLNSIGFVLIDKGGVKKTLSKSKIINVLIKSNKYIEILYNKIKGRQL